MLFKSSAFGEQIQQLKMKLSGRHEPTEKERVRIFTLTQDDFLADYTEETEQLIAGAESRTDEQRGPEDYLILATEACRAGDYARALDYGYAGLRLQPESRGVKARLFNRLGAAYAALGVDALAMQNFDQAIAMDAGFVCPLKNLAAVYLRQNKPELAANKLIEATSLRADNAEYHCLLAQAWIHLKKNEAAEGALQRAIVLNPVAAEYHARLGAIYYEQDQRDNARASLLRAIELKQDDPQPHKLLAQLYFKQGLHAEAEKKFKDAIAWDPNNAGLKNQLGDVYFEQKRFFQAEDEYKKALRLDPQNARAHKNLGHVYMEHKRFQEAERMFKESIRLDPQSVASLIQLRIAPAPEEAPPQPADGARAATGG